MREPLPQPGQPGRASDDDIAWRPSPEHIARSRLRRLLERHGIADVAELRRRSVVDLDWFWRAVLADLEIELYEPFEQVVDLSRGLPWARWLVGAKLNWVHNALDRHAASPRRQQLALVWEGDDGAVRRLTYGELAAETSRLAAALRALGVGRGDRVGIFLPMVPEAAIATLACSKIGAIYTPIFSGYAAPAVASRLADCEAKLLLTADGFLRRGSVVPLKEVADAAVAAAPSVERVLVLSRLGRRVPWQEPRDVRWADALAGQPTDLPTERTDAEDPYMVIYTSGTTGRPKGAVHVHAGFPLKAAQDLAHCFDLQGDDVLFWLTDMGWMMGPWAVSGALTLGATLLIYEGAPDYPQPDRLWDLAERHGVTVLGVSPTAVRALLAHGDEWPRRHDLSALRVLGSTGEPWNPGPWWWLFREVGGGRCPIVNYTGGTEVSGGILGGTTLEPLKPCAFTGPVPGMDADVLDAAGQPVRGAVGELVIRRPWPGMARGFWRDPERYLESYWSRWPDVWVHGDWALHDLDCFWYVQGRSDDTIKVAGKRVGPAEVESAAVAHPAVLEAAAIGVPDELRGEVVVLFAVLRAGREPSDALREEIRATVVEQLGRPLRPAAVRFVRQLPKTLNGKVLRRLIRAKHLGLADPGDLSALGDPAALEEIGRAV